MIRLTEAAHGRNAVAVCSAGFRLTATVGPRAPRKLDRARNPWPVIFRCFQDSRGVHDVWAGIDGMSTSAGGLNQARVRRAQVVVVELATLGKRMIIVCPSVDRADGRIRVPMA